MATWKSFNDHCRENASWKKTTKILWLYIHEKGHEKRTLITQISQKKIPFSLICSDLSLTLKKAPFSENSWTGMLTHIVNVVPREPECVSISIGLLYWHCGHIQPKKIPLSLISSDLSLTLKKAPFPENPRTRMFTHIVKLPPPLGCHES